MLFISSSDIWLQEYWSEYFKCEGDLVRKVSEVRSCPGAFWLTRLGSNFDPVGGSGGLWLPASG